MHRRRQYRRRGTCDVERSRGGSEGDGRAGDCDGGAAGAEGL